jgi:integration host factor subunit beta
MVKSELVQKLCNMHPNVLRKDIEKVLETIFLEMVESLCNGKNIEIRGFGSYKVVVKKARKGRNPKNSQSVQIQEKKAIKWKMSKILFNKLNKKLNENLLTTTN